MRSFERSIRIDCDSSKVKECYDGCKIDCENLPKVAFTTGQSEQRVQASSFLGNFFLQCPMTLSPTITSPSLEDQAVQFFQDSVGQWRSERRYYTLKNGVIQEVVSDLKIAYLEADAPELAELAKAHGVHPTRDILGGVKISWDSEYAGPSKKTVQGSTVFGIGHDVLFRDRGFATPEPITAQFDFPSTSTMLLRTEYNKSLFEEEVKFISDRYRTRQTVISRAGEEQMVGQYLERRVA